MGIINYGNQILTYDFRQNAISKDFNRLNKNLHEPGIYSGGEISISGVNTIDIDPIIVYILDDSNDVGIRIETLEIIEGHVVAESTPYIVLRFEWNDILTNYMDVYSVSYNNIQNNDVIIGKALYIGGTLTSISYADNTISLTKAINNNSNNCKVIERTISPFNKITILEGELLTGIGIIDVPESTSDTISDTILGRNDLICLNDDGSIYVIEGEDSTTPTTPPYLNRIVLAEIRRGANKTTISNHEIFNIMPWHRNNKPGNAEKIVYLEGNINKNEPIGKYKNGYDLIELSYKSPNNILSEAIEDNSLIIDKLKGTDKFLCLFKKTADGLYYINAGTYDIDTNTFSYIDTEVSISANALDKVSIKSFENGFFGITCRNDTSGSYDLIIGQVEETSPSVFEINLLGIKTSVTVLETTPYYIEYLGKENNNYHIVLSYGIELRTAYYDPVGDSLTFYTTEALSYTVKSLVSMYEEGNFQFAIITNNSGTDFYFRIGQGGLSFSWISSLLNIKTDITGITESYSTLYFGENYFLINVTEDIFLHYIEDTDEVSILSDGIYSEKMFSIKTDKAFEILQIGISNNSYPHVNIIEPKNNKWKYIKTIEENPMNCPNTIIFNEEIYQNTIKYDNGIYLFAYKDNITTYPIIDAIKYISYEGISKYEKLATEYTTILEEGEYEEESKELKEDIPVFIDIENQKITTNSQGIGLEIGLGKAYNRFELKEEFNARQLALYDIVIGNYDTPKSLLSRADIIIKETDDLANILNQIIKPTNNSFYPGKRILLLKGIYNILQKIDLWDGTTIEGMGTNTILKVDNSISDSRVFYIDRLKCPEGKIILSNFDINLNHVTGITGIEGDSNLTYYYNLEKFSSIEKINIYNIRNNSYGFVYLSNIFNCSAYNTEYYSSDSMYGFDHCKNSSNLSAIYLKKGFTNCFYINYSLSKYNTYSYFEDSYYLNNCKAFGLYDLIFGAIITSPSEQYGFSNCSFLNNCVVSNLDTVNSNYRGYYICSKLVLCNADTGGYYEYHTCGGMSQNLASGSGGATKYTNCFADQFSGTYPVANTPNGGFNG